jgi:selenide,water dikinase
LARDAVTARRRLVLVGGGHAHVEVLRRAEHAAWSGMELVLISPDPMATYSGMLPGVIGGRHARADAQIDLQALAARAGAAYVSATVTRVHGSEQWLEADGARWAFDACSLDIGSAALPPPTSDDAPIAMLRPVREALALPARVAALPAAARCAVVGGGAAGIEVACAIHAHRLTGSAGTQTSATRGSSVTIVQRDTAILPGFPPGMQRAVTDALQERGFAFATGAAVTRIDRDGVHRDGAPSVPAELVIWAAGAAPPGLLAMSTVPRSTRGYLAVDETLRAIDGSPVWGAGDCVDLAGAPWVPKSGVYAVRQGPVLAHNLLAYLTGGRARAYDPQRYALAILDLADGTACAARGPLWFRSRWLRWFKDAIDRRFIARYR